MKEDHMNKKIKGLASLGLSAAMLLGMTACNVPSTSETTAEATTASESAGDTAASDTAADPSGELIKNGSFEDQDMSMWQIESSAPISASSEGDMPEGVKSYGTIDRNAESSTPYDCFAQDITASVQQGTTYNFSFYARLSDDYANAPDEQRVVDFAPYITADGNTNYLGSYSPEITGKASQVLKPGEWTKFEGTFTPAWSGTLEKAVIRVIEQGTNYGSGDCVKGDYSIAAFSLKADGNAAASNDGSSDTTKKEYEADIPDLSSVMSTDDGIGKDAITGVSLVNTELSDEQLMNIVTKHFNGVTLGNELKLDSMLGYNNDAYKEGSIHKEELNGEEIDVPELDHSRADMMLDYLLKWNQEHPDKQIKVRGHVLVWHSQAPEWFFHEDYDKTKDYVSKDVMNKRLEWYIKTMLEYYTGENSKYKGMFYGWDVVNEAISDQTASYRTDVEQSADQLSDSTHGTKSSWWKVYQSNEYIINAFKWANKYGPADLELYYNDYNECDSRKREGIIKLIKDVKKAEGTRIDGFGMQGHYSVNAPSQTQIEESARAYAAVVDKIMLTELDVKVSAKFNGSTEGLPAELNREGHYYRKIWETMKALDKEEGINVSGITVWGVIDPNSWLQTSNTVGGAADGSMTQYPLLFDGNYQAKPAYYGIVDPSKLEEEEVITRPEIEIHKADKIKIDGELDDAWSKAEDIPLAIPVGKPAAECTSKVLWDEDNLYVYMVVKDAVLNDKSADDYQQDSIEVFIDENNGKSGGYEADDKQYRVSFNDKHSFNGEKCLEENMKAAVKKTDDGYIVEAAFKWTDLKATAGESKIGLELQVNDAGSAGERIGTISWADDTGTGYMSPEVLGTAALVD